MRGLTNKVLKLALAVSGCLWVAGCSSLNPTIKQDDKIDLSGSGAPCLSDASKARQCAEASLLEISGLLAASGKYRRASAFTALTLATATGGVLAFEGSEDVLKGIAVVSGGLLGLNAVVDTDGQQRIYNKALMDLSCSIRAYDALKQSDSQASSNPTLTTVVSVPSPKSALATLSASTAFTSADAVTQKYLIADQTVKLVQLQEMSKTLTRATANLAKASAGADQLLLAAVIRIRQGVREGLSMHGSSAESVFEGQSDRIVGMVGDVIESRTEAENIEQEPIETGNDVELETQEKASTFLRVTAPVAAVFEECADPSIQRQLTK